MKKDTSFLSFIEDLKSEINNIKNQINEVSTDDYNRDYIISSKKSKTRSKSKNKNNKNLKSYDDFESPEGTSVMTTSIEGNSQENYSYEGKTAMTTSLEGQSIMNSSIEGKSQMYNSKKTERVSMRKDLLTLDELIERKTKKFAMKGKESLSKAIIYSEIIGKPKSLK